MKHLSPVELVDGIEGTLAESRALHLAACDECRRLAEALRATRAEARGAEMPEPSPLFWDHFAARVREAVAAEPERRSPWGWLWRPALGWSLAIALVVLIVATVVWRGRPMSGPRPEDVSATAGAVDPLAGLFVPVDEASWELVATVAAGLAWEDVEAIGFTVRPGSADRAVLMLTPEERSALARLLEAELPSTKS